MAEIIKTGYLAVPEYDLVCKHCGTLSRFQKHELRFFEGCYDEELVSYDCPYCDKETTILKRDLPEPSNITNPQEIKEKRKKSWINNLKMRLGDWY